jgi:hypothetical protein
MAIRTTTDARAVLTRVVSIHDGALDDDAMSQDQVVKYITHLDMDWLRFVDGDRPTIFEIGPIDDVEAARKVEKAGVLRAKRQGVTFDPDARQDAILEEFFCCGTRAIENLDGADFAMSGRNGIYRMGDTVRDRVPLIVQREIGGYIQRLTNGTVDVRGPEPGEVAPAEPEPRPDPLRAEAFDVPKS